MASRCGSPLRRRAGSEGGTGSLRSAKGWLYPRTSLERLPLPLASLPHKAEGAVFPVQGPAEKNERNFPIVHRRALPKVRSCERLEPGRSAGSAERAPAPAASVGTPERLPSVRTPGTSSAFILVSVLMWCSHVRRMRRIRVSNQSVRAVSVAQRFGTQNGRAGCRLGRLGQRLLLSLGIHFSSLDSCSNFF